MALSNHERVGKALELLNKGLSPFVEREMKGVHGDHWQKEAQAGLRDELFPTRKENELPRWDTQGLLSVVWNHWNDVFKRKLGHSERSLVSELREVRNKWAHQESFSTDDAYRALDSIQRLLAAVSAEEAGEVEKQKQEILRIRFAEQARLEKKRPLASPSRVTLPPGIGPGEKLSRLMRSLPQAAISRPSLQPTLRKSIEERVPTNTASRRIFFNAPSSLMGSRPSSRMRCCG